MQQLEPTVQVFHQGRAAFHPITVVAIQNALDVTYLCVVDMAAHHPLVTLATCLLGHRSFEVTDEVDRLFDLVLEISRERPVRQAELGAQVVQVRLSLSVNS